MLSAKSIKLSLLMYDKISKLPHGSGINYDWQAKRGRYKGKTAYIYKNAYHYMDSAGGYNGVIPFNVYYDRNFNLVGIKLFYSREYLIEIGAIELYQDDGKPSKRASYEEGKFIVDNLLDYFYDIFPANLCKEVN